jgi:hypothetical protein
MSRLVGISATYLKNARSVLRYAPDLVPLVRDAGAIQPPAGLRRDIDPLAVPRTALLRADRMLYARPVLVSVAFPFLLTGGYSFAP